MQECNDQKWSCSRASVHKAYMSVFVSFTVKAVYLEAVSERTTTTFIVYLRKFIVRWGKPMTIKSDHCTNFVEVSRELKDLQTYLRKTQTKLTIDKFCSDQGIQWSLFHEHAPHYGGLWEAVMKSLKLHFRCIVGMSVSHLRSWPW